jgi:ribosomal protein L37AE/L43A
MTMNRVQFQPGLSMPEFLERYGTEAKCQAALQAARWPDGFACPECGAPARTRFVRGALPCWQCGGCQHQCSLISGTILDSSKLPPVALGPGHAAADPVQVVPQVRIHNPPAATLDFFPHLAQSPVRRPPSPVSEAGSHAADRPRCVAASSGRFVRPIVHAASWRAVCRGQVHDGAHVAEPDELRPSPRVRSRCRARYNEATWSA